MPLSPCLDNLLYHQYLKGDTQSLDDESTLSNAATCQAPRPSRQQSHFHWDLQSTCKHMIPAFNYISHNLAEQGLQVALIISEHGPYLIPVWHLPRKSQIAFTRIVRRACARYKIVPGWMTAIASVSSKKDLHKIFEAYKPDAYLIRRSILQNQIIYTTEGLTLLSIDHVYTLKQLLCTLSKKQWISYSRQVCLSSCAHLLHRINTIYKGTKFSKGYMNRVYKEIPLKEAALDEVMTEYNLSFSAASIRDVPSELNFGDFSNEKRGQGLAGSVTESQDSCLTRDERSNQLVSPLADVDLTTLDSWEPETTKVKIVSPVTVSYPSICPPSIPPPIAQEAEIWYRSLPSSPINAVESQDLTASPSPLNVVKRASTYPTPEKSSLEGQHTVISALEKEKDDAWERNLLEARSREIINAWNQEVVCSRCYDVIEAPRRYTLCY